MKVLVLAASISAAVIAITASIAQAGLVVYEPFAGYSSGSLTGQFPNATGLDTSFAYAKTPGYGTEYLATGLVFGSLLTAGDAELVASGAFTTANTHVYMAAKLGSTLNFTGTLYGSYLVKIGSFSNDYLGFTSLMAADDALGTNNRRFSAEADGTSNSNGTPGVRYQWGSESMGTAQGVLEASKTYLVISKFTNVGTALSGTNPGVATVWTLTATQFGNFVAGGCLESWLDTANNVVNRATISEYGSGTYGFDSNTYLRMACYANSGGVPEHATFDEIRFGTALADVTPTPEPGTLILAITGLLALLAFVRYRQ